MVRRHKASVGGPAQQVAVREGHPRCTEVAHREWTEILLEDRKAGPAETAAARMDIADWFSRLPKKKRRIAATLATGETTKRAARKFHVTPGRISQTRRELEESWGDFQGGPAFA